MFRSYRPSVPSIPTRNISTYLEARPGLIINSRNIITIEQYGSRIDFNTLSREKPWITLKYIDEAAAKNNYETLFKIFKTESINNPNLGFFTAELAQHSTSWW